MNLHVGMVVPLLALILIQGCTGKDDTSTSQQNAKGDAITQEEGLIVTTLNNVATAESQFYRTKDSAIHSPVLRARLCRNQRWEIRNAQRPKASTLQRYWSGLTLDEPIGISSKVMNIKPSVAGSVRMGNL